MEWERGDTPPGRVISNLKTGGLRILLEQLVEAKKAAEPRARGRGGGGVPGGDGVVDACRLSSTPTGFGTARS